MIINFQVENENPHVLAAALMSFLKDLEEPLIPSNLRANFIEAGKSDSIAVRVEGIRELLQQLPNVNLKTLARLVKHLSHVSKSSENNMEHDLAKVFAPLVIRYSSPKKKGDKQEYVEMVQTMFALLLIDENMFENRGLEDFVGSDANECVQ